MVDAHPTAAALVPGRYGAPVATSEPEIDRLDRVDRIIAEWRRARPDLDTSGKAVTARLVHLAELVHGVLDAEYAAVGLKRSAYSALVALRRAGEPFELTPSQLTEQLFVTSGGTTLLLDRLERDGLVTRREHPTDRRGVIVRLTDAGRRLVDAAMERHAAAEQRLVAGLSAEERDDLAAALRHLMLLLDRP